MKTGNLNFGPDTFQEHTNNESIRVSYRAVGMEAIVAPNSAVLVN